MSIKVECDGCGKQIDNTPVQVNGWFMLSQVIHFPVYGQDDDGLAANCCTASCIVLYLQKKGLVPREGEVNERQ